MTAFERWWKRLCDPSPVPFTVADKIEHQHTWNAAIDAAAVVVRANLSAELGPEIADDVLTQKEPTPAHAEPTQNRRPIEDQLELQIENQRLTIAALRAELNRAEEQLEQLQAKIKAFTVLTQKEPMS